MLSKRMRKICDTLSLIIILLFISLLVGFLLGEGVLGKILALGVVFTLVKIILPLYPVLGHPYNESSFYIG